MATAAEATDMLRVGRSAVPADRSVQRRVDQHRPPTSASVSLDPPRRPWTACLCMWRAVWL